MGKDLSATKGRALAAARKQRHQRCADQPSADSQDRNRTSERGPALLLLEQTFQIIVEPQHALGVAVPASPAREQIRLIRIFCRKAKGWPPHAASLLRRRRAYARRPLQNSFGPRRSSLASHVNNVAATTMATTPPMLTESCIAKLAESSTRITWATKARRTPRSPSR